MSTVWFPEDHQSRHRAKFSATLFTLINRDELTLKIQLISNANQGLIITFAIY